MAVFEGFPDELVLAQQLRDLSGFANAVRPPRVYQLTAGEAFHPWWNAWVHQPA